MRSTRLVSLALAAAAACATAPAPPGPPPFEGVKRVALVRWRDPDAAARPRDPLDALKESLDERGYATQVVEIGRRVPDTLRPVQRLYERVGALPRRPARAGRERVDRVGAEAGEAARALGVDAVALYHRSRDLGVPVLPEQGAFPRPGFPPPAVFRRPGGALSLVDARGAAVSLQWGVPGEPLDADASAPLNAAEAIDALLRVLSGGADGER
jgi:hypothetical protein